MEKNAFYRKLVDRYKNNKATEDELEVFFQLLREGKLDDYLTADMEVETDEKAGSASGTGMEQKSGARVRRMPIWGRVAAAVLIVGTAVYVATLIPGQNKKQVVETKQEIKKEADFAPGGNRATLTLADNSVIELDSTGRVQFTESGTSVQQEAGHLKYLPSSSAMEARYNTLVTPSGGQYRLTLSDGTTVWLNARSSIRFPVVFTGNERMVEVTGEAYFEVAPLRQNGQGTPFMVKTNTMDVQVLGTHFNIMSYDDESSARTTLLEGSVRVHTSRGERLLTLGQQAQVKKDGSLKVVDDVDAEEAIAWKNGFFHFQSADIGSVMRQIERWYDVEAQYENTRFSGHFTGVISRYSNLSHVLDVLRSAGVPVRVEDERIIVP